MHLISGSRNLIQLNRAHLSSRTKLTKTLVETAHDSFRNDKSTGHSALQARISSRQCLSFWPLNSLFPLQSFVPITSLSYQGIMKIPSMRIPIASANCWNSRRRDSNCVFCLFHNYHDGV